MIKYFFFFQFEVIRLFRILNSIPKYNITVVSVSRQQLHTEVLIQLLFFKSQYMFEFGKAKKKINKKNIGFFLSGHAANGLFTCFHSHTITP